MDADLQLSFDDVLGEGGRVLEFLFRIVAEARQNVYRMFVDHARSQLRYRLASPGGL